MHEVLVKCLGGLSLPRKSVIRLTDRSEMTIVVYCGAKTTTQQQQPKYQGDINLLNVLLSTTVSLNSEWIFTKLASKCR